MNEEGGRVSTPTPAARVHTSEHAATSAATFAKGQSAGSGSSEGDGLYRLLVESVHDYAIFALDPTGHVLSWNPGAQRFKGYEPHEIIGKHFRTFYSAKDREERRPEMELEVAKRDGRVEDEGWRIRKDGTRFWANVVITALRDASGKLVGFAKVTRDLTERKEAEDRAIADARRLANAEEANRAKAAFLASMSHELRTPLNAIAGYTDLLLSGVGGKLSTQQRDYLDRILRSEKHLLAIINDILNFSRIEAGQLTYDLRRVSMRTVVEVVIPMIEVQATLKSLTLEFSRVEDVYVTADRAKVEQILVNLLGNSVKFTPAGGRIEVVVEGRGDIVQLQVRDTGIGIPDHELSAIFEPFVQVGRTLTTTHEGTGLGLAISSDLAHAMGGDLTVTSRLGEGSTFTLTLPRAD
jgi:PAS domain S-box-containing protein